MAAELSLKELSSEDRELVKEAADLIQRRGVPGRFEVAAALRSASGRVYLGLHVESVSAPCSMCAEYPAVGRMVVEGESRVETVAAVRIVGGGTEVIPPCGRCRQLLSEFGDPYVVLQNEGTLGKIRLSALLPAKFAG